MIHQAISPVFSLHSMTCQPAHIPRDPLFPLKLPALTLVFSAILVCPFFMTHHAPAGALGMEPVGDLIVAMSRGAGKSMLLPFVSGAACPSKVALTLSVLSWLEEKPPVR